MDNSQSQSSDVFSDKDLPFNIEEEDKLEVTLLRLKSALCGDIKSESRQDTFSLFFSNTLLDCASCINQKLKLISIILDDPENLIGKLAEVLEDVIALLKMMSSFLKNVLEAVTMSCNSLKIFPITTGQVLLSIFTHCKESENLYGEQLQLVEEQLKNLFKACHELQMIYLMILEKHFIFDLAESQELDVLMNALEINLQIGEIVQALDLKTMAEQWKAYTIICERYSHYLIDKRMFQDSTLCLCGMITYNVGMAYEQDVQKAALRSLKVSNFAIKIIAKLCHIFKHAVDKRLDHIVKLLVDIQMKHPSLIENNKKSPQFVQAMNANVLTPVDSIVLELLSDDIFRLCFFQYSEKAKQSDSLVGYLILMISITKCLIQSNDDTALAKWTSDEGSNLFYCLFSALRQGHTSLNLDYKFNISSNAYYCGLNEYLLIHTSLLALHCNTEQYGILENTMLGALLGVDVYSAMFASDLWLSLARISPTNLTVDQLSYLNNTYKQLYTIPTFATSPQQTYLSNTITRLFKCLPKDEKNRVYYEFDLRCDTNRVLWIAMKIKNLPDSIQRNAEGMVVDGLKMKLEEVLNCESIVERDLLDLTLQLKLAATCSFVVSENIINEVVNAWLKVCPVANRTLQKDAHTQQNCWFSEYVEALQDLTMVLLRNFQRNSQSLIKVLHAISKITSHYCCIEIKLTLINLIFKLTLCEIESNPHTVEQLLQDIYMNIFKENHYVFKTKLFELAFQQIRNKKIKDLISKITEESPDLEREWNNIQSNKYKKSVKDQLKETDGIEFTHKCLATGETLALVSSKSNSVKFDSQISDSFELSDIDGLFKQDGVNDQPAIKKAKPNSCEVDGLLDKLDSYITDLSNINVPVNYRDRVLCLSERLRNIVEPTVKI